MTSYNLLPLGALSIPELRRDDTPLNRTDIDALKGLVTFWNCRTIRPSLQAVADRAGMGRRTFCESLRHLKEAGAVRVWKGAHGGANFYALNLSAVLTPEGLTCANVPAGWYAGYRQSPPAEVLEPTSSTATHASKSLTPVPSRVTEDDLAAQSAKRVAKQKAEAEEEAAEKARLSEFNAAYPRGAALPAQWAEARRHAKADVLIRAARAYAAQCKRRNTQERYITLARNWLKNHAWEELLPNGGEVELTGAILRDLPGDAQVAMSRAERAAEDAWDKEYEDIIYSGGLTGAMSVERAQRARDARRKAAADWVAATGYDVALHLN
nr:MAG TPA: winged helix-turn-helix transcription repressor [Caudoviricetes sp.]